MIDTMVCAVEHIYENSFLKGIISAMIGTLCGTVFGYEITVLHQKQTQSRENIFELSKYFFNLEITLRNLSIFISNLIETNNCLKNDNTIITPPAANISFNWNENKLDFIAKNSNFFYESINQLRIEFLSLNDLFDHLKETQRDINYPKKVMAEKSNNEYKKIDFYTEQITHCIALLLIRIVNTMLTIDDYLKTYNKTSLTTVSTRQNINAANKCVDDYLQNLIQLHNCCQNILLKEKLNKKITQIYETREEWRIEFPHIQAWHVRAFKKIISILRLTKGKQKNDN